jgi:hypothetical protein
MPSRAIICDRATYSVRCRPLGEGRHEHRRDAERREARDPERSPRPLAAHVYRVNSRVIPSHIVVLRFIRKRQISGFVSFSRFTFRFFVCVPCAVCRVRRVPRWRCPTARRAGAARTRGRESPGTGTHRRVPSPATRRGVAWAHRMGDGSGRDSCDCVDLSRSRLCPVSARVPRHHCHPATTRLARWHLVRRSRERCSGQRVPAAPAASLLSFWFSSPLTQHTHTRPKAALGRALRTRRPCIG